MIVLIIEEHLILLESLGVIVTSSFKPCSIIPAKDGKTALQFADYYDDIDVIILNLQVSDINNLELINKLIYKHSKAKIIVSSVFYSPYLINKLKELKVSAFLDNNFTKQDLNSAINSALNFTVFHSNIVKATICNFGIENESSKNKFENKLNFSSRELEIIEQMMTSKTNKEIAECLFLSNDTIKFHRKNIYKKADVSNLLDLYKLLNNQNFFA